MKFYQYILILFLLFALFMAGCTSAPKTPAAEEEPETAMTEPDKEPMQEKEATEEQKEPEKVVTIVDLIAKESSYFADGALDEYTLYTYNDEGLHMMTEELYTDEDVLIEKRLYTYENGLLAKTEAYDASNNLQSYYLYKYDISGNLISEAAYDNEDELQLRSEYEYNTDGKKIKWSIYSGNGALFSYTEYIWDNGKNTRINTYTPAGKLDVYFEDEYDTDGNRIKSTQFEVNGNINEYRTYSYSAGGLIEEVIYRANGSVKRKVQYTNDEQGNPTEIIYLNAAGKVQEKLTREYLQREVIEYIEN